MNERIRELALEADLYARSDNSSMLFENYQKRYTEKFSELLVRECARIADRKYLYSKEPNRWDSGFNISCEILEQFGILEDERTIQRTR